MQQNELPVVTVTGPKECAVSAIIAPCRHCGHDGQFHIPAFPANDEDDDLFDAHVQCPICECTGPAACHDMDSFFSTRTEAMARAVYHWNREAPKPEPIALGMTALQAIRRLNDLNDILSHPDTYQGLISKAQLERAQIFAAFK